MAILRYGLSKCIVYVNTLKQLFALKLYIPIIIHIIDTHVTWVYIWYMHASDIILCIYVTLDTYMWIAVRTSETCVIAISQDILLVFKKVFIYCRLNSGVYSWVAASVGFGFAKDIVKKYGTPAINFTLFTSLPVYK